MIDANGISLGKTFSELRGNYNVPDGDIPKAYRIIYNLNPYRGADMLISRRWVERYLPIPIGVKYHDTYFAACAVLSSGLVVVKERVSFYRIHEIQITKQCLKEVSLFEELKRRKNHICFNNKVLIIKEIEKRTEYIQPEARSFINEFNNIQELDKMGGEIKDTQDINKSLKVFIRAHHISTFFLVLFIFFLLLNEVLCVESFLKYYN